MDKRPPTVEWIISQSDADWERLQEPPRPDGEPSASQRLDRQRYCWRVAACLLLLATSGSGGWRGDQTALPLPAASMTAPSQPVLGAIAQGRGQGDVSLPNDQWEQEWWRQFEQAYSGRHVRSQPNEPSAYVDVTVQTVEFVGDRAVARVIINARGRGSAYRQTWFYRHTEGGWLRTEPNAALWGSARSLDTQFVTFHYRQQDEPAVLAVAPQVNQLYTTLRRNLGLPRPPWAEKLVIEVSVTQSPGNARFQTHYIERFVLPDRWVVASPAVYLAPVELTDAELLAQSVALPLIEQMLASAKEHHAIDPAWQPLLDGLRLWQLWDLDLPLAAWREDVVTWLSVGLPTTRPGQPLVLPARYPALCAAHRLWMVSPVQLHIPLMCAELDRRDWYIAGWQVADFPRHLAQLAALPSAAAHRAQRDDTQPAYPGQAVALATLIEYAVATYGRERLPMLVAGLGQYESWDTLLPAVYEVSPDEFEAGWQAYLATHYGVPS